MYLEEIGVIILKYMASTCELFSLIFAKFASMLHCTVYLSSSKTIFRYLFMSFKSTKIGVVFSIKISAGNNFCVCKKEPEIPKMRLFLECFPGVRLAWEVWYNES